MDISFIKRHGDGESDEGVYIRLEGTGDATSGVGAGYPVLVEVYNGQPCVRIWADINQEDPTHVIYLHGALEKLRVQTGDGWHG